ncbi:MAG: motility associated factor glycosyltransferase family protein [Candidatus Omnitrophica bacterium]|nr:motility associated factor glycosyltransferase family protein [Candidatus Omnitrophota bacterium]
MSDYLEKNLESLQKRFPVLAQRLAETESDGTVRIESASTGDPTAAYLLPNGGEKRLHSSRDPKREAHRWAESIALKQNETVALFGPGLGYPIEALGQVHGDKLGGMWIFEGSIQVFRAMLSLKDWTWLIDQPGVLFFVEVNETEFRELTQGHFQKVIIDGLQIAEYEPGTQPAPEWHRERGKNVSNLMLQWASELRTVMERGKLFTWNTLSNLRDCGGSYLLRDVGKILKGKPAIMVSAGPSLDRNAELLKKAKGKIPIVAVDTALRIIGMKGIAPDWVVTIDALGKSVRHYENIAGLEHIPLVYDLEATVDLTSQYPGPKILMGNNKPILYQWLEEVTGPLEGLMKGLTVAQATFGFLAHHGADPIILVGQDLSYDPKGGKTHATGAAFQGQFQPSETGPAKWENPLDPQGLQDVRMHWVPGNHGDRVPTDNTLLTYLKRFEDDIAKFRANVINATDGGALIQGTRVQSLEETYAEIGLDNLPLVGNYIGMGEAKTIGEQCGEKLRSTLSEMVSLIHETKEHCQSGFERSDKLHRDLGWKSLSQKDLEKRQGEIIREFQWLQRNKKAQLIIERGLMTALYMLQKSDLPIPEERTVEQNQTAVDRYRTFFNDALTMVGLALEVLEEKKS